MRAADALFRLFDLGVTEAAAREVLLVAGGMGDGTTIAALRRVLPLADLTIRTALTKGVALGLLTVEHFGVGGRAHYTATAKLKELVK